MGSDTTIGISKDEIIKAIKVSLKTLTVKDNYLIIHDLSERCLAHRLALYLERRRLFKAYNIDCEYNKNRQVIKDVFSERCKKVKSSRIMLILQKEIERRQSVERRLYPDIIIHTRNTETSSSNKNNNLIVFEIKKDISDGDNKELFDWAKLVVYRHRLKYKYCFYIKINDKNGFDIFMLKDKDEDKLFYNIECLFKGEKTYKETLDDMFEIF